LAPLFCYLGGKQTEIKHFALFIPQHGKFDLYVEAFVGGGTTYFHLNHPGAYVVTNANLLVINFYQQVQAGSGPGWCLLWSNTPIPRPTTSLSAMPSTPVAAAAQGLWFYYLCQTCFCSINQYDWWGRFNSSWNHTPKG
jgi:DNA adenine methylase